MIPRRSRGSLVALISTCLSVAVACGGSGELTRPEALRLLQEAPPGLLADAVWQEAIWDFQSTGNLSCEMQRRLGFGQGLAKAGFVELIMSPYGAYDQYRPGGVMYQYEILNSDYITHVAPEARAISFLMGKAVIGEVTGIVQEATTAVAEATVAFEPTPIATVLLDSESEFTRTGQAENCSALYDLPVLETRAFRFVRYDDGWRLEGRAD